MKTKEIINSMKELQIKFYNIQCKNWIASKSTGFGEAGRTLEILLGKKEDQYSLPDFQGIEIKTKLIDSEPYIGLFAMALDNRPLEMKRLLDLGGYADKKNPQFKVFQVGVWGNFSHKVGKYYYRLRVDYHSKVVRLRIFNLNGELIEETMSWSFSQLQSRLEHKLKYLAFINVKKWHINNKNYFKYLNLTLFELKDFNTFLYLVEKGIIRVVFKLSYVKKGEKFGEIHDHGTTFEIKECNLTRLFHKVDL